MENNDKIEKKLIENWELFLSLLNKIDNEEIKNPLLKFCEEQQDRIIVCPASVKSNYIGAFPGGLIWHSLNVLKIMKEINKIHNSSSTSEEMILTSLFHDIGKIGDKNHDYYLPQQSEWHRDRGILFEVNSKVINMPIISRSLWWLNQYNVPISENIFDAMFSLYSSTVNNKMSEVYNVSNLSLLLQNSVRSACVLYKGKTNIL